MQLPLENDLEDIQKVDLSSRFVLPILQSLFDEQLDDRALVVKFGNRRNLECQPSQLKISERRPGGPIQIKESSINTITPIGFLEAKKVAESKNHSKVNADLLRLGVFGKNVIDTKSLRSVILIQAVGKNLTFYLMSNPTEDIYLMTELDHIKFPLSVNELQGTYDYLDNICDVLYIFSRECANPDLNEAILHRGSIRLPLIRAIISKRVVRKLKNSVQHYCL
ncbi:uncharacterized protein RHIMIDRAFT_272848 [Rhizopus microsporus ATCC 52813]|uniref:Uncharacterized protein n=2 Tax=Rhizopus microsporus TaxID=58291 RepID=A0A2G4T3J0_RHIZD|nr:uncharacterized protein RHIMIDRAFT_272848 [Rhizopus microsporus ATCC 52813]PHZ15583.1 hypothetical protein RHIMIDRAFT_272848 [Rhizopus microsporus ATCC 52813]